MPRIPTMLLAATALASSTPATAADALKFGPPPAWVTPHQLPVAKSSDAPVSILLNDQQLSLEPGRIVTYSEGAMRIQNPQGLAAGNLSLSWDPATETVTINKLEIRRGDKVIDVLASGQTFTTLRRETSLEAAMLDGTLTANIQPEDLQVGDLIVLATTTEQSDPVLKGHVEALFAQWNTVPFASADARLSWPAATSIKWQQPSDLPTARSKRSGNTILLELDGKNIQPQIGPKGAPARFNIGRLGEATDFSSWSQVADLLAPLFRDAAVIAPSGSLRDELNRIRSSTTDPKSRAEQALRLVQDRTRYVALLMGQGSLVPASAEETWKRRFGDCKAKTALLLALLRELGIEAEPVLVNSAIGDAISDRLPMVHLFNHVLIRAHIGGKTYWLDGTRTGDTSLDGISVPNFGWGLPLIANAQLVHIVPQPLATPSNDTQIAIDATGGIYAPAPINVDETLRSDLAVVFNTGLTSLTDAQRQQFLSEYFKKDLPDVTVTAASFQFDKERRELHLTMTGEITLDWTGGYYQLPNASIGFKPDFDRSAGPLADSPFAVEYPAYSHSKTVLHLPNGFFPATKFDPPPDIQEALAGVEYRRSTIRAGDVMTVETSTRSLLPEVAYKDAISAKARLTALANEVVSVRVPRGYRPTDKDLAAERTKTPASAPDYVTRGNRFLDAWKLDEAIADFTKALALDPKNVTALADRGLAYVWKGDQPHADKDLAAAHQLDPHNSILLRAQGLTAERNGECGVAIAAYTASLASEPGNSFALAHRAMCERTLGQDDTALADSELALRANPAWEDLRVLRANIFMRQDKRDLVAAEADALTRDNPTSDFAFVAAAKTYAALGQRDRAMQLFERALANKRTALIYINRSQVRAPSDQGGKMADLDEALKLEPQNPDALAEKAKLLMRQGKYDSAIQLLDLIKTDKGYAYAQVQRAILMYKAGHTAEAQKLLKAARAGAKTPSELNRLCWAKATQDVLLESALQDCRDALKTAPDNGAILDSLGMVLLKLGRLDEALNAYNQAIAKRTGAASLMGRAFVYLRKGDRARAEADAAAARKLSPDIDSSFADYGLKF